MAKSILRIGLPVLRNVRLRRSVVRHEFKFRPIKLSFVRNASSVLADTDQSNYVLPPLMAITPKDFGLPFMTAFKMNLYLKPYVDKQFDQKAFLENAKKALTRISTHLANNSIDNIKKYVTEEAFQEISHNFSNYSAEQKLKLKVNAKDILYSIPFSVDIERDSDNASTVKIMVFFDVLCNIDELKSGFKEDLVQFKDDLIKDHKLHDIMTYMKSFEPALDSKYLCFYQFVRNYGPGIESEWKVSKVAHYLNKDIWNLESIFK